MKTFHSLGRRNPLKSGLLSYPRVVHERVVADMRRRNPLKSGLLSYPQAWPSKSLLRTLSVAIPSNRGCCPTQHSCPVTIFLRGLCRNPLKSGLLSYPNIPDQDFPFVGKLSQSPQIGAAVLPGKGEGK